MNAPSLSLPSFAVDQVLIGRVAKNRGEPARVVEVSSTDGRLLLQYANGKRRWSTLATALASYRLANEGDHTASKAVQWLYNGPAPVAPEGNQFTDFAPPRPGLVKGDKPAGNDTTPEAVAPELVDPVTSVLTPGPVVESPVEVVPSSGPGVETEVMVAVPSGMALTTIEGMSLATGEGRESLVRDITLGEHLGLAQPRDIRKLIKRYAQSGDLSGLYVRAAVARTQMPTGGVRETRVDEFWLTEEQALFIVAKSETAKANEMTRQVIRVFTLARRGQFAQVAPAIPTLDIPGLVTSIVGETVKAIVPMIVSLVRPAEPDLKAAEALATLKQRQENAQKKANETRDFKKRYPSIRTTYLPLLTSFLNTRMDSVDMRDVDASARCLRPSQVNEHFVAWLRERKTHTLPEQRAVYTMLKELSGGLRADMGDETTRVPWALKTAATGASRQTSFPVDGGGK